MDDSVFFLEALKEDGSSKCTQLVSVICEKPYIPVRCEDFGYDFEIAKYEWEGSSYEKEYLKNGYSVSVSGDASVANWTADPAVAGVIAKASTVVEEFAGGTSGSISKTQIGTGKHDISNIAFCGNNVPEYCELEVLKSVDKTIALPGEELTYTIDVTNIGGANCSGSGVKIFDEVDENITFLDYTLTSNIIAGYVSYPVYTDSDRTLRFNGDTLTPGESGTIIWTGIVNTPNECGDFEVTNQAKATALELNNYNNWSYSQTVKTDISNSCVIEEPTCTLTPADQAIDYGTTANLTWTTENATAVTITDFGSVALNGTDTTTPLTENTSYVLTATGAGGEVNCYANVEVLRDEPEIPECPLTAADGRIIVTFEDLKLRTDKGFYYSQTDIVPMTVNPGTYDITLVSWDGYNNRVLEEHSQPNEQWQLQFMNGDSVVGESGIIGDLEDMLREVTKIEKVNTDYILTSAVTGLRAIHPFYPDEVYANSLYPICAAIDEKTVGVSTVVASKIVCTDEADLPNYGEGGPNITENTAADWVATHESCSFVEGWEFEWTEDQTSDPGDILVGKAGSPWNSFGPTDANGKAVTEINLDDLTVDNIYLREVLQDGYIPFTHGQNAGTNVDDVSAEFYCSTDVLNYDNRDYISGLEADNTYYCVAWNSPIPKVPAPSCDLFTASPSTITVGESSTLTWETSNALEVYLNTVGAVSLDGTTTVSPADDITYILTLVGEEDQTVDCEVPVIVSEDSVPVCEYFTATPDSFEAGGGDVELEWKVTDATDVSISPTVGTVGLTGTETLPVTESTTYILTATDDNGDETTCSAPVVVADPTPFSCANNVSFTATPDSIKPKQNVILEWSTTDVDSVSITHINLPGLAGSEEIAPADDITYVLTATQGEKSIECPVDIEVSSGGGGGSSSPRCELEISETLIDRGDEITLTWDSTRATEVTLSDDLGNIIFTTDDFLASEKEDYYDGSIDLNPTRDTEYTLLVERGSKDRECKVDVEVKDDVVVIQTRDQQPLVAGISLTQVPYTGFEAGPILTIIFYVLIAAWALYVAYYIVIQRKAAVVSGFDEFISVDTSSEEKVEVEPEVKPIVTSVAEIDTTPINLPVGESVIGYANSTDEDVNPHHATDDIVTDLENRAHAEETLLSSDAIRYFIGNTIPEERDSMIDKVIAHAKKMYPLEDGWVVINEKRMIELCKECAINIEVKKEDLFSPTIVPEGTGSLAEAIVTGNIVAAYEMIGSRPMFSLADAAADLDAVYRSRRDEDVRVSNMLLEGTKNLSDGQIKEMISALTSALDGTYTDEASAVKMAIIKAVKASA